MADPVNGLLAARMDPERRRRIGNALLAYQYDRETPQDAPVTERAGLFPLGTYANGQTGIAWPGIVATPVEKMAQVLRGEITPGTPEFNEAGFDIAGAAMVGGLAAARPRGSLGMSGRPTEGQGIRAYHGSPHDFDRFDMSKIGTGEGAQAYGHGLYFAEKEGVARKYRDDLSVQTINGAEPNGRNPLHVAAQYIHGSGGNRAEAIAALEARAKTYHDWPEEKKISLDAIEAIKKDANRWFGKSSIPTIDGGKMYEVNIKANPDDFLDWDKPISQQSEKVRRAISTSGFEPWQVVDPFGTRRGPMSRAEAERIAAVRGAAEPFQGARGKDIAEVAGAGRMEIGQRSNSTALREAGIPGIKYLDQGSRASGEGSRNYVVFDDNLIEILRKYGLLGMLGAGGMAQELMKPSTPNIPDDAT